MTRHLIQFITLISLLWSSSLCAEEIGFSASVNKRLLGPQEILSLSLTITGVQKVSTPQMPIIEGLNLVYGPSVSSQTQILNGEVRSKRVFEYGFSPTREGKIQIPSFEITIEDKKYQSEPVEIEVKQGAAATSTDSTDATSKQKVINLKDRIFVKLEVDKTEAVVNEQVILSFKLFRNIPADNLSYDPPVTQGFLEEPLGKQRGYRQIINGIEYEVIEIRKALFPLKSGILEIPAVRVQGTLLFQSQSKNRSKSSFDSFFNDPFSDSFFGRRYIRKPIELLSESVTINVKPLPEADRPDSFSSAVGDFSLDVTAKPQEVAVGDPITLTMVVSGEGNLQNIQSPKLKGDLEVFKMYEPESKTEITSRSEGIQGKKSFDLVLVPKEEVLETPVVEFSFFNPEIQDYETIQRGPFSLKVTPATTLLQPLQQPLLSEKKSVELLTKDIFYIKSEIGEEPLLKDLFNQRLKIIFVILSPLLFYLGALFIHFKREKLRLDPSLARYSQAGKQARQALKQVSTTMEAKQAFSLIEKVITDYLSSKTGLAQGAINHNELDSLLEKYTFSAEKIEEINQILKACELSQFAGETQEKNSIKEWLSRTKKWLDQAEKQFK